MPKSTLAELEAWFAVMISRLPSPSTSPMVTEDAPLPVARVACAANEGKALMVGKPTKFTPMVPVPVMPVTLTV